ncbi:MAG: hypothetical protein HY046_02680 [Acidobacteria bacterium]|nr:hypothetical protein [Acidobacteriota bacterium]
MKKAEALMRAAFEIPATGEGAEFNKKEYPSFLLSRGRPTEAMTAAEVLAKGKWPLGRTVGQALLGQIYLSMGKTAEAESALAAAQKEFDGIRTYGYYGRSAVQPYLDSLRGELFLRAGKFEEAGIVMKKVAADIRAVIGPDAWSQALFRLEAMARAARDAGDWELAQFMAEQMLAHDSSYAGTHYALALVAKHRGDVASAQAHSTAAEKLWSSADPGLPELGEIKSGYRR